MEKAELIAVGFFVLNVIAFWLAMED